MWGTIVMGVTGLMVWFKVEVFGFLSRWIIDVALSVHFYEAILATLAIVVWHLYNVIFDPDVYPVNWAAVDGGVSEEFYREEHELDYERLISVKEQETKSADGRAAEKPSDENSTARD